MSSNRSAVSGRSNPIEIVDRPIDSLRPDPTNPRQHDPKQIKKLARSIETFGFNAPILIDKDLKIIAGHGRLLACKSLGITQIPTISLPHLSTSQAQAYMIADNRLSEIASWNDALLAEHFKTLSLFDLDFQVDIIGFDVAEIDLRIASLSNTAEARTPSEIVEEIPPPPAVPISCTGDLWTLGDHRIFCGNSLDQESYVTLLDGKRADVIFTDPPYNVRIAGNASGLGRNKHQDFAMASGEMTPADFIEFLTKAGRVMAANSQEGSIHYICMDWRHIDELSQAGSEVYSELKNICVWVKTNAGMGSFYRSQHELVFVYKNGSGPHRNNIQLGRYGRNRTNVWNYPGATTSAGGDEERRLVDLHPTVKPVTLVADALMDCSKRNDIVLDPFSGSGTTIIAAQRTGRRAYVIEMDTAYVDVAVRRWQAFTRQVAVHAVTGKPFGAGGL